MLWICEIWGSHNDKDDNDVLDCDAITVTWQHNPPKTIVMNLFLWQKNTDAKIKQYDMIIIWDKWT